MQYVSAVNVKRVAVAILACAVVWQFSQLASVVAFAAVWYMVPKA